MLNLLKMDFYRFLRNKYFWITLLVYLFLVGVVCWMSANERQEANIDPEHYITYVLNEKTQTWEEVRAIESGEPIYDKSIPIDIFYLYGENLDNYMTLLFFTIFGLLFVSVESSTGYIKNIACIKGVRGKRLLSNVLITTFGFIVMMVAGYILASIIGIIQYGNIGFGSFGVPVSSILTHHACWLLAGVGVFLLIYLIYLIINQPIVSMIFSVLISLGAVGRLVGGLDNLLKLKDSPIYSHLLVTQMQNLPFESGPEYATIIVSATLCILVFSVAGTMIIRNKDIR